MAQVGAEFGWRWGETCLADKDPALKGKGTSTPSQTAWALIGLFAGEDALSENAKRGVRLARGTAERRRAVGIQRVYRHRFPEPSLSPLPYVRTLLSSDGARSFPKENRSLRTHQRRTGRRPDLSDPRSFEGLRHRH